VGNRVANRSIRYIIIHVTQGGYMGAVKWFQNAAAGVSAHYIINNWDCGKFGTSNRQYADGQIAQSVNDKDLAYHDKGGNSNSIGIEHAGIQNVADHRGGALFGGFSTAMYESSARLSAYLCRTYNIPLDRDHIFGHVEDFKIGGSSTHIDPGPTWDWPRYMSLVQQYYSGASADAAFSNDGDAPAVAPAADLRRFHTVPEDGTRRFHAIGFNEDLVSVTGEVHQIPAESPDTPEDAGAVAEAVVAEDNGEKAEADAEAQDLSDKDSSSSA